MFDYPMGLSFLGMKFKLERLSILLGRSFSKISLLYVSVAQQRQACEGIKVSTVNYYEKVPP